MGGHHKATNWGCPDTVDTNGSSPMELWSLLTTYRKSYMGFSKNLLLDP